MLQKLAASEPPLVIYKKHHGFKAREGRKEACAGDHSPSPPPRDLPPRSPRLPRGTKFTSKPSASNTSSPSASKNASPLNSAIPSSTLTATPSSARRLSAHQRTASTLASSPRPNRQGRQCLRQRPRDASLSRHSGNPPRSRVLPSLNASPSRVPTRSVSAAPQASLAKRASRRRHRRHHQIVHSQSSCATPISAGTFCCTVRNNQHVREPHLSRRAP